MTALCVISIVGWLAAAADTIVAHVRRSGIPAAPAGALYLATDANTNSTFNGNAFSIDGNDWNMNNTAGTAAAIPGARLELIDGMGHDMPRQVWPRLVDLITENAERAATPAAG